ncbi:MAG: hypothetical protein JSW39_20650 [Desulfobacterales bacterium]|nr:MAG: hypothetical protein JSW39_20650 [Desulfobacterales bacterium]
MKQKYLILKSDETDQFIIREFAELDKEVLSLLCEENYDRPRIESAIANGKEALISALRTKNLYPPGIYADKIAEAVIQLLGSEDQSSLELFFDDIDLITKEQEAIRVSDDVEAESGELDDLLDENFDDDYEDKDEIHNINSSLKVADDEYVDLDEDS